MIEPFLKHQALLDNIRNTPVNQHTFYMWWLGQSGFLIQWLGKYLLLDPYLSDSLTLKYASTDKPHVRMTARVLDPGTLDFINVVTSSHNHTDHLDADTLLPLLKVNPSLQLVIPEANRSFVCERLQCPLDFPIGLSDGDSITIEPFTIFGVPAAHNQLERDASGRCVFMGYVVKFGTWTIYHSGDTLWYSGMEKLLASYNIDLALLPINGNKPERRVAGNLNYREAPQLAKAIGAQLVIPCHYHMFTFNTEDPAAFAEAADSMHQPAQVLQCGEPWNSDLLR